MLGVLYQGQSLIVMTEHWLELIRDVSNRALRYRHRMAKVLTSLAELVMSATRHVLHTLRMPKGTTRSGVPSSQASRHTAFLKALTRYDH